MTQFINKPLPNFVVKNIVRKLWSKFGAVEVLTTETGIFLIKFENQQARDGAHEAGMWHIDNKPLILRKWIPKKQMLKFQSTKLPVWVKFSDTTVPCQTPNGLTYRSSGAGILCTWTLTASRIRLLTLEFVCDIYF
jgi:hypothetical protein